MHLDFNKKTVIFEKMIIFCKNFAIMKIPSGWILMIG